MKYFHTVRFLRPRQLMFNLKRRGFAPRASLKTQIDLHIHALTLNVPPIGRRCYDSTKHSLIFINDAYAIEGKCPEWAPANKTKLWLYNLHYFDWLHDHELPFETKCAWIENWIAENPPGVGIGWDPYPTSLRIVNWIKFFLTEPSSIDPKSEVLVSLSMQTEWLTKNLEYHLLANHLLKNAVALVYSGSFFDNTNGRKWLALGTKLLEQEVSEQFLSDGGHFERSPLYHAISLEDLLDVQNICWGKGSPLSEGAERLVSSTIEQALSFFEDMLHPDGEIALMNDSAIGVAPRPQQLLSYAARLTDWTPLKSNREINRPDSGYFGYRSKKFFLLIDGGPIGPDYQPGHGHCDCLSFELSVDGQRLIVDSGVSSYEAGALRNYYRSTRAHNTVSIDGMEQSEIWGSFRVARRARILSSEGNLSKDGTFSFAGSHDGFKRVTGKIVHHRVIQSDLKGNLEVVDKIFGIGAHRIESFLHFDPRITLKSEYGSVKVFDDLGRFIGAIETDMDCDLSVETGLYGFRFGTVEKNQILVMRWHCCLPKMACYKIQLF